MLPELKNIFDADPVAGKGFFTIGDFISKTLNVVFMIAFFLTFFWLVWGAFQYIFAGGDKEGLAKARTRMISAIIGLILIAIAFALAQFIEQILKPITPSPISLVTPAYAASSDLSTIYGFGNVNSLGEAVSNLIAPVFSIATVAVVIYFLIGGFKYLTSAGDKNAVSSGRNMITHAIVGFLLLMFIFLILQFIPEFFGLNFSLF